MAYNIMARVVNIVCVWTFYYINAKTFWRSFSDIDNLYLTFYRSYGIEYCGVCEHIVVWSYIQLFSSNLGGSYMECVALVTT